MLPPTPICFWEFQEPGLSGSVRPSATASCEHGFLRTHLSSRALGPAASMAGVLTWVCKDPDTGETQAMGDLCPEHDLQQRNPPMATA